MLAVTSQKTFENVVIAAHRCMLSELSLELKELP